MQDITNADLRVGDWIIYISGRSLHFGRIYDVTDKAVCVVYASRFVHEGGRHRYKIGWTWLPEVSFYWYRVAFYPAGMIPDDIRKDIREEWAERVAKNE